MYLLPWLGSHVRPFFERKGARVKRKLKAQAKGAS
jgi:hypothetical protein